MPRSIYMDNHSTTPVDPRVLEAMLSLFRDEFGNAGSINHDYGHRAKDAVEKARETIAAAIGASPREIVFTSGATESNNLALRGACERDTRGKKHLVSVVTEHKAVLDPLDRLSRRGYDVTLLPVAPAGRDNAGRIDLAQLESALRGDTLLVSVMLANNEIGVLQPVAEIGKLCRDRGIVLHCDATQAVGKMPIDVAELHVDLLSFSAHKLYGPKGVGALFVRRGVKLAPLLDGGGQEQGLRSGTLNVPGIVGLGCAVRLAAAVMEGEARRLGELRDRLFAELRAAVPEVVLHGPALRPELRLAGNLNVGFPGVDGDALLAGLSGLAVSSGSACTTANPEPSHVLRALSVSSALSRASLRFGLGRFNTAEEVPWAVEIVAAAVRRLNA